MMKFTYFVRVHINVNYVHVVLIIIIVVAPMLATLLYVLMGVSEA